MKMNEPGWTSVTTSWRAQNSAVPVPPVVTTSTPKPAARRHATAEASRDIASSHSRCRSGASRTCWSVPS
jgi:hypothetical protein